jgi:hypothetical protein
VFGSPVVTHPVCDLDLHQRIREARRDVVARSVGRRGRTWPRLGRRLRRDRPVDVDAAIFAPAGEDVAHAFRF